MLVDGAATSDRLTVLMCSESFQSWRDQAIEEMRVPAGVIRDKRGGYGIDQEGTLFVL